MEKIGLIILHETELFDFIGMEAYGEVDVVAIYEKATEQREQGRQP